MSHVVPHTVPTRFAQAALHCGAGPQVLPHRDGTRLTQFAPQNARQAEVAAFHDAPIGQNVKSGAVHRPPEAPPGMHVLAGYPVSDWHLVSPFTGSATTQSGPQHAGRTAQTFATHGSQLGVMPVAVPVAHSLCAHSAEAVATQQEGDALQTFVAHGLQLESSATPGAHGSWEHAPFAGLSQY